MKVVTSSFGRWISLLAYGLPFLSFHSVDAPAHKDCIWSLHRRRAFSWILIAANIAFVIFWIWPKLKGAVPASAEIWVMCGTVLVLMIPQLVFEFLYPPSFDIELDGALIRYEFTNEKLAEDFAENNQNAELFDVDTRF